MEGVAHAPQLVVRHLLCSTIARRARTCRGASLSARAHEGALSKSFEKHSSKINHIHFSESHRGVCGDGQVKWYENKEAVENAGYYSWIVIEAFAHDIPGFSEIAHVWRPMFETKLQLCQDSLKFCKELMNKELALA